MSSAPTPPSRRCLPRRVVATAVLLPLLWAVGACGYGSRANNDSDGAAPAAARGKKLSADEVRIGYFANITHATPLVGVRRGLFARELGGTRLRTQVFNAGPSEIEALNAGAVDIGWIGPSPAINGYTRAHGRNLKIISGSASGGVSLVVNPERISSPKDLKGRRIASPQFGNTQDVALLNYLTSRKFAIDTRTGKGEVTVVRQDNKEIPTSFRRGGLDGAWVPEPTASELVAVGGKVLLDEKSLWKDGRFVITNVIVSARFLREHPDVVEAVLRGSVRTNAWISANPGRAKAVVSSALKELSGRALPARVLDPAFENVDITNDPLASTLSEEADHAVRAGLLEGADLKGIYDLAPLNKVLRAEGQPEVDEAGLGGE